MLFFSKKINLIIELIFLLFFNDTATTEIYTLSLHDALPIYMINPDCMDIYCRKFNELVLPILLHGSPSMDARTISDFVFDFTRRADESPRLKKADVYQVFSILSSYLKDCYGKEQLAMYMSVHVQGMPTKSSIVTKL